MLSIKVVDVPCGLGKIRELCEYIKPIKKRTHKEKATNNKI